MSIDRSIRLGEKVVSLEARRVTLLRLSDGDGAGTGGEVSDRDLKPRVDFLHTAFLWLAGLGVTGLLAIATLIVTSSNTVAARIDRVDGSLSTLNRELGVSANRLERVDHQLDRVDKKLDELVARK